MHPLVFVWLIMGFVNFIVEEMESDNVESPLMYPVYLFANLVFGGIFLFIKAWEVFKD